MAIPDITVIKGGRVIDGTGKAPLDNATVIIENKKIKTVSQNISIPTGAHVIDAHGKTVMPGMIDAHMHCNGPRPEDTAYDKFTRPKELRLLQATEDAREYLSAGFTTVKSCGGMNGIHLKQAASEGIVKGVPRLISTSYFLTSTTGNPYPFMPESYFDSRESRLTGAAGGMHLVCDGVDACVKATRFALSQGADFAKIWARGGLIFSTDELKAIVQTANNLGKPVSIHTENSKTAESAIQAGAKTIDHATGIEDKVVELGMKNEVIFVSTLICLEAIIKFGQEYGRPRGELEWAKRFLEVSAESYVKIKNLGGTLAIGTDNGGEGLIKRLGSSAIELELLVKYCEHSSMEAIVVATKNSALAGFVGGITGTLEPGKFADILIVDGDPLTDIKILQDKEKIKVVMLEGEIVVDRREGYGL